MAASINSLKVNSASGRSSRDNSFDHVSTIDFNVVKPMGIFEMVPGDHINITPEMWMRTQAMNVPTFGKMDVVTRAFFVPLRLTWSHFNNFYRQAPTDSSGLMNYFSSVPFATMWDLSNEFLRRFQLVDESYFVNDYHGEITNMEGLAKRLHFGISGQASYALNTADFTNEYAANTISYRFNPIGKRIYDLFNSMGYRWQFFSKNYETSHNKGSEANCYRVSILPLLGWIKMFSDWYCPSEFKYLFSDVVYDYSDTQLSDLMIKRLFDHLTWAVFIYFNDDIFSMCETAPYKKGKSVFPNNFALSQIEDSPNTLLNNVLEWHKNTIVPDINLGGRNNNFEGTAPSGNYSFVKGEGKQIVNATNEPGTPRGVSSYMVGSDQADIYNKQVSNWSVMAVLRAAQWLQRNNLLSGRVTEYLKAKFGVTPTAARLDIAEYIGHAGSPVKISDIAGTGNDNLAELGAKGTSYSIDKLSYTAEEFGYLYFTVELRPRIGYGQGVDPLVLRTRLTEFFNQEFDALGFEPVPTECLVSGPLSYNGSPYDETMNNGSTDNRIFGYLPRMWSYKCKHDNLSGDFMLPNQSYDGDLQSYHLMRTVVGTDLEDFVQNSLSFRYAGLTVVENKFSRIFRNDDPFGFDHFQLILSFDAWINGLPLAMNESWQVNADHDERQGHLTNIQGSL